MQSPGNKERSKLFALILTQHRRWGTVLMPYILERMPGREYYSPAEALSPFPNSVTLSELTNEEREAVRLVNEYSDRNLYKLFSKHKNVKEFIDNVTDHVFEVLIKPYIEARITQCLRIADNEEIHLFLQKAGVVTLHPEDTLKVIPVDAKPVFRFDRGNEETSYQLLIESAGMPLDLRRSAIEILANKPCVIRADHSIHFVAEIEGTKLKPFLTREKIIIPAATEERYFSSFVLQMVNTHTVTGTGFTLEHSDPEKHAFLTVERNIIGVPSVMLKFRYDKKDLFIPDDVTHFTTFSNEEGRFVFHRNERDTAWEKKCKDALEEAGFFTEDGITFLTPGAREDNGNALYDLIEAVSYNRRKLEDAGFIIRTGSLDKPYCLDPLEITLSHNMVNDWFDLKAVVEIGSFTIPFTRFRRNIIEGLREYVLPDGTVALLPEEWFARYRGLFEMGQDHNGSLLLHKQHFGIISELASDTDCEICNNLGKLVMPEKLPPLSPPSGLMTELRPYQKEGLSWLYYLQMNNLGGCLADDMGLGKTLQTLALLMWNREQIIEKKEKSHNGPHIKIIGRDWHEDAPATSLIIVPASLCHNWYNEITRFCPALRTLIHYGAGRKKNSTGFSAYDIIISSYHTVRQDIELLSSMNFFYTILDESQHIKNPTSHIYRAVMQLRSDHRLVLTGTPVENSLTDLWTQLNFVNPGLLGSLTFFKREFARPIEQNFEEEKEQRLRKMIRPFIMRRTKEMVVRELPPVTEQTIHCDMSEEQASIYEREKSAVRNLIMENVESFGIERSAIIVLQGLMKLRQLANHPIMTDEAYQGGSGKFDTVTHNIGSVVSEGHKILIFSSFVKHLDLFPRWLEQNGIGYAMLTGSTRERGKVIDSFRNDDSIRVFLISLKAGGVGLNLTEADYVFILDPWWNPAAEIQALSRAHRIGQEKRVFVYRYISGETIEEKIQKLQGRKSKLAGAFINANNPFGDLNVNEMIEILN